jgi:ribosomal protein L39E
MAKGGSLKNRGVEQENIDMVKNQTIQVGHHAEELKKTLKSNPRVDAWVVAKMDRATSNLSDITHYLDGEEKSFAKGGTLGGFNYSIGGL